MDVSQGVASKNLDFVKEIIENGSFDQYELDTPYAVYYHTSKYRFNILKFYVESNYNVLEYGAKCGAITACLKDCCASIDVFEEHEEMKRINKLRHQSHSKVHFIDSIDTTKQYNLIILVDAFFEENEWKALLIKLICMLKIDGRIIIATDNRLGMKYLSGVNDFFYLKPYIGVEGYPNVKKISFTKQEWKNILSSLKNITSNFTYPYPDHRFTNFVFSDFFLPSYEDLVGAVNIPSESQLTGFNELRALNSLTREEFTQFSNSFLITIQRGHNEKE